MRSAHETENKVHLGLPRIIQRKDNAPEFDYSSFYVTTGMGHTGCLVAQDSALLTKVRTLIHEEISLLTVLYFPFRERTPFSLPSVKTNHFGLSQRFSLQKDQSAGIAAGNLVVVASVYSCAVESGRALCSPSLAPVKEKHS